MPSVNLWHFVQWVR